LRMPVKAGLSGLFGHSPSAARQKKNGGAFAPPPW
jgi:hypothetical protein